MIDQNLVVQLHSLLAANGILPPRHLLDNYVLAVLDHHQGNKKATARSLGIGRQTLYNILARNRQRPRRLTSKTVTPGLPPTNKDKGRTKANEREF